MRGDQEAIGQTAELVQSLLDAAEITPEAAARILDSLRGSGLEIDAAVPAEAEPPTPCSATGIRVPATERAMANPVTPDLTAAVQRADLEWAREAGAVVWQTLSDERARKIAGAVAAAERERIRQMAVRNEAVCTGDEGTSCYFADLIREPSL